MKKLLLTLFAFAALAPAAPIQQYVLEIANNPYDVAGDYTVTQSGPQPYEEYVSSGELALVIAWRENAWIRSFSFHPCLLFGPCVPLNYTVFAALACDPPAPAAVMPEPATWVIAAAGALAIACGRRKRARRAD
jgi:hypothetical protein